ncbi:mitochondrial dynamics protein MID49 isoform X2 [Denticeps clupeoides]|uniref:Uncharacterized protein n=1 Tax=Denticeps clupeoides TaxID=299321 RepID=A0AAY4CH14_9TELE|nr:mitochondrial dynamics protein MID51-like isoform X2 [Denticeps clupeoides]
MYSAGRRRGEDGIAVVIDFLLANARLVMGVGGAAVLGVATLLVKRLMERAGRAADQEKDEKQPADSWEELSLVNSAPKLLKKGIEGVAIKQISAAARKVDLSQQHSGCPPAASPVSDVKLRRAPPTLQDRLQQYYHTRVCVSRAEAQRAHRVALEVGAEIQAFLRTKHPEMPLGDVSVAGSLLDELQVLRADRACLLVALQVEETLWTPLRGEDTFLSHPHLCMLRRENLEYFPRGRSYWDRFLVGGYMSSRLIGDLLRKSVTEAMNWPSLSGTLDCEVRPLLGAADIELEVLAGDDVARLVVTVLPAARFVDRRVLSAQLSRTGPYDHAWYHSLYSGEAGRLAALDQSDGGVRRKCLKTLTAVCRTCPALSRLGGRHLRSLILRLSDQESDWSEGAFSGRFRQAIVELIGCLEVGQLPSYFKPAVNLLSQFGEDDIDEMGFLLYCALSEPEQLLM